MFPSGNLAFSLLWYVGASAVTVIWSGSSLPSRVSDESFVSSGTFVDRFESCELEVVCFDYSISSTED